MLHLPTAIVHLIDLVGVEILGDIHAASVLVVEWVYQMRPAADVRDSFVLPTNVVEMSDIET